MATTKLVQGFCEEYKCENNKEKSKIKEEVGRRGEDKRVKSFLTTKNISKRKIRLIIPPIGK